MPSVSRRTVLGSSFSGLAAALSFGSSLSADDLSRLRWPADAAGEDFAPATLFLTWQRDPTTTMTIQWVGRETPFDTSIDYATLDCEIWLTAKTVTRPFPNTDMKVHRCELTGLKGGVEYRFQIGASPREYRFRTMPAQATNTIQFVSGGDCGTGPHAVGTNILAARQEPYFALIGGDLAYDNGRSPETFLAFLKNYSRHMVDPQGRMIPMLS